MRYSKFTIGEHCLFFNKSYLMHGLPFGIKNYNGDAEDYGFAGEDDIEDYEIIIRSPVFFSSVIRSLFT